MRYVDLRQALNNFVVFSLRDIRILHPSFAGARLNEWQKKGYIKKLLRGYYIFSDLNLNENVLFHIANKIYSPSYVSLEAALSSYGLIPESTYVITSASTRKTYQFKTPIGEFAYRTIRPRMFWGYHLIEWNHRTFRIATPEKALLDYFYFRPDIKVHDASESLRIDRAAFFERISKEQLLSSLDRFGQKSLTRRVSAFLEFMEHA